MNKVKIRLPASITNPGPGLHSLGLAVGLHTIVEISERSDHDLVVEPTGEGAGRYSIGLQHPVVLGLMRIFQQLERAPLGLTVRIDNRIPLVSGLGAEATFLVAGVIGANNLIGGRFSRTELLRIAAQVSRQPDRTVTAILGGLTASTRDVDDFHYRSLPVAGLRIVIALPELPSYLDDIRTVIPERVLLQDALHNLSRVPLLLHAFEAGDFGQMGAAMDDRLYTPFYTPFIPGYADIVQSARDAGAAAVTLSGNGPALIFFAPDRHRDIAIAVEQACADHDVTVRTWILPVDTQGVVVSVMQSS